VCIVRERQNASWVQVTLLRDESFPKELHTEHWGLHVIGKTLMNGAGKLRWCNLRVRSDPYQHDGYCHCRLLDGRIIVMKKEVFRQENGQESPVFYQQRTRNTNRVPSVPCSCAFGLATWPFYGQSLLGGYRRRPFLT